jgi:hypothetical protein
MLRLSGLQREELELSGGTKEGVQSRKKTPGLKNMKVHEQMGRYYQVTHTVVQPTI